jgi:long-chain acyl-CoA synthetase
VEELFLLIAARIGYWQGSAKTLMDDIATLRPTLFVGVPRIFDRIYSGVNDKARRACFLAWSSLSVCFSSAACAPCITSIVWLRSL